MIDRTDRAVDRAYGLAAEVGHDLDQVGVRLNEVFDKYNELLTLLRNPPVSKDPSDQDTAEWIDFIENGGAE